MAVPLGYVFLVLLHYLFSRHRAQLLLCYLTSHVCLRFRGCAVVLGIELSVNARHQKTRTAVRAASCAAACCSSSERRCAAQISNLRAMRVKQNNEFGPIRAPENNDFCENACASLANFSIFFFFSQAPPTKSCHKRQFRSGGTWKIVT